MDKAGIVFPLLQARSVMEDLANGWAQGKGGRPGIRSKFPASSSATNLFSLQVLFSPLTLDTPRLFPFTEAISSGYDIVSINNSAQLG